MIKFRITAVLIVIVLLASTLVGCRREPESIYEPPEFAFLPDVVRLPEDFLDIGNLVYLDNMLYFSAIIMLDEMTFEEETKLFLMNPDGTNNSQTD